MKVRIIIIIVLLAILPAIAHAQDKFITREKAVNISSQSTTSQDLYDKGLELYNAKKYAEAFSLFKKSAEMGDEDAQNFVGYMYREGEGVDRDNVAAFYWYQQAANQGNLQAYCIIGRMYMDGEGVDQDYDKAIFWFRKCAARRGPWQTHGLYYLGICYENGYGVQKDLNKAIELYEKSNDLVNYKAKEALKRLKNSNS